jgi:hypothetical protein
MTGAAHSFETSSELLQTTRCSIPEISTTCFSQLPLRQPQVQSNKTWRVFCSWRLRHLKTFRKNVCLHVQDGKIAVMFVCLGYPSTLKMQAVRSSEIWSDYTVQLFFRSHTQKLLDFVGSIFLYRVPTSHFILSMRSELQMKQGLCWTNTRPTISSMNLPVAEICHVISEKKKCEVVAKNVWSVW